MIFSAVVHEEAAEMFGMEYLCKQTFPDKKLGFDLVFLCEPTGLNVVLGQRGKVEIISELLELEPAIFESGESESRLYS